MKGGSDAGPGSRTVPLIPAVLLLIVFLVAVPAVVAGCGSGGESTTTTVVSTGESVEVVTTSSATTVSSTVPLMTSTTGIVITLPSTSTTGPTTTTTEKLSSAETRLANGHIKAMGFIDQVYVNGGKRYISIDYAEMLTGAAADAAAVAAGEIPPGEHVPNDYWISNANPQKRVFEVSDSVAITTSTRWVAGEDMNAPCTWADFRSFWGSGPFPEGEEHLHSVPWWIERDGPLVVKIDEQYLP
jgi:hypothetical protein